MQTYLANILRYKKLKQREIREKGPSLLVTPFGHVAAPAHQKTLPRATAGAVRYWNLA